MWFIGRFPFYFQAIFLYVFTYIYIYIYMVRTDVRIACVHENGRKVYYICDMILDSICYVFNMLRDTSWPQQKALVPKGSKHLALKGFGGKVFVELC